MALKRQEKKFLIGIGIFGFAIALFLLLSPLLSALSDRDAPPEPSEEHVRVELANPGLSPPKIEKKTVEIPEKKQPKEVPEKPEEAAKQPKTAVLVLEKPTAIPTEYFEDGSGVAPVPRVVERYLEKINNGSRFIGRLEAIALRDNNVLEEQRKGVELSQPLSLQQGSSTKVISFNMKIKTPFLSAHFDTAALNNYAGDVLVEWIDQSTNSRVELFFTPLVLAGSEGHFRLKMPEDIKPPASEVFVYSATEDMPLIAQGVYSPD